MSIELRFHHTGGRAYRIWHTIWLAEIGWPPKQGIGSKPAPASIGFCESLPFILTFQAGSYDFESRQHHTNEGHRQHRPDSRRSLASASANLVMMKAFREGDRRADGLPQFGGG